MKHILLCCFMMLQCVPIVLSHKYMAQEQHQDDLQKVNFNRNRSSTIPVELEFDHQPQNGTCTVHLILDGELVQLNLLRDDYLRSDNFKISMGNRHMNMTEPYISSTYMLPEHVHLQNNWIKRAVFTVRTDDIGEEFLSGSIYKNTGELLEVHATSHLHPQHRALRENADTEPYVFAAPDFDEGESNVASHVEALPRIKKPKCFDTKGVKVLKIGIAVDHELYVNVFNRNLGQLQKAVDNIIAGTSAVYEEQFGFAIQLAQLHIHDNDKDGNSPASLSSCNNFKSLVDLSISFQDYVDDEYQISNSPLEKLPLWHFLTGCNYKDALGVSKIGSLCYSQAAAVTAATTLHAIRTCAHELGHVMGSYHTQTGIMVDKLDENTELLFDSRSLARICSKATEFSMFYPKCGAFKTSKKPKCGDGIMEGNEECECANQKKKCKYCKNCKVKKKKECTPQGILNGAACCTKSGAFRDATTSCDMPWARIFNGGNKVTGQCMNGVCKTQCGKTGNCTPIYKDGGCMAMCEDGNPEKCSSTERFLDWGNTPLSKLPDGIRCANGGTCRNGKCVV